MGPKEIEESLSYQVDNLSRNQRISSDAVIADFVDKQNSSLASIFFPLVYIVSKNMQSSLPELEPFSYHVDMI